MVMKGMQARGYEVEAWTSDQKIAKLSKRPSFTGKWLGYADQFLIYPSKLRKLVNRQPENTLFVVTDQALGMWVPCLAHRHHVIHCHDFLALKSALGEFAERRTGWTGRQYQRLIRRGFSRGRAFISVSGKTRGDLHRFLPRIPKISEVVHNGLNHPFRPMGPGERISLLKKAGVEIPEQGFIIHISGNQWYKNPEGVLAIYRSYAGSTKNPSALWMVGSPVPESLRNLAASIPAPGKVQFISGLDNEQVNAAYSHARALLFPSLEEGFGWPVVEAMAAECPVVTTNAAPMTETAGDCASLIPRMPETARDTWAESAAKVLSEVVHMNEGERANLLQRGRLNAARFDTTKTLDAYEGIYSRAMTLTP